MGFHYLLFFAYACASALAASEEDDSIRPPETTFRRVEKATGGETLEVLSHKDGFLKVKTRESTGLDLAPIERWCTALIPCLVDLPRPLLSEPIELVAILREGRGSRTPELGRFSFVIKSTQDSVSSSGRSFVGNLPSSLRFYLYVLLGILLVPLVVLLLGVSIRTLRLGLRLLFFPFALSKAQTLYEMEDCSALQSNLHEWTKCAPGGNCSDSFLASARLVPQSAACFHVHGEGTSLIVNQGEFTQYERELLYYTPTEVKVERVMIEGGALEQREIGRDGMGARTLSQGECTTLTYDIHERKWKSLVEEQPGQPSVDQRMMEMIQHQASQRI